jgi:hypothetical protein
MVNVLFVDGFLAVAAFSVVAGAFLGGSALLGSLIGRREMALVLLVAAFLTNVGLLEWQFVALSYINIEDQSPQEREHEQRYLFGVGGRPRLK